MNYITKFLQNTVRNGIILFIIAAFASASLFTIVKILTQQEMVRLNDILYMRSLWILLILSPLYFYRQNITGRTLFISIPREILNYITLWLWYTYGSLVPFNNAVAISFVTPILSSILAITVMRERNNYNIWLYTLYSIIGMVIVLSPDLRFNIFAYYCLFFSAILRVGYILLSKILIQKLSPIDLFCHHIIVSLVLFAITNRSLVVHYGLKQHLLMLLLSFIYIIFTVCSYYAIQLAGIFRTQSLDYIKLPVAMLFTWFIFHKSPNIYQIIGSIFIGISSILIIKISQYTEKRAL